jgi:DNA modification methylase
VLARKPVSEKNIADNCLKHGTGALNIAESRVGDEIVTTMYRVNSEGKSFGYDDKVTWADRGNFDNTGRYPSNVIGEIDEPYQKYFYCPKISRKERHTGFDLTTIPTDPGGMLENNTGGLYNAASKIGNPGNNHPTVKPVELMKYLIRLVTPEGGLVVDPFNGSGSTGMAAVELGYDYLGIDLDPNYVDISLKRIAAWEELHKPTAYSQLFTE